MAATSIRRALGGAAAFFWLMRGATLALAFLLQGLPGRTLSEAVALAVVAVPLASVVTWRLLGTAWPVQAAALAGYLLFHWWLILTLLTAQAAQADPGFRFPIVPLASPAAALLHLGLPFLGLAATRLVLASHWRRPRHCLRLPPGRRWAGHRERAAGRGAGQGRLGFRPDRWPPS